MNNSNLGRISHPFRDNEKRTFFLLPPFNPQFEERCSPSIKWLKFACPSLTHMANYSGEKFSPMT